MKLHAAIKVGLLAGLVIGLCLQFTVFLLFYATAYNFKVPGWIGPSLLVLGWPVIILTTLYYGPLAARSAGDAVRNWRDAALVGGGAGLTVGVATYFIIGALAQVMVLGVVPLIAPLTDPSTAAIIPVDAVLRPVVQQAIVQLYTSQIVSLISWAAIGALTAVVYVLLRPLLKRKVKAAQPA